MTITGCLSSLQQDGIVVDNAVAVHDGGIGTARREHVDRFHILGRGVGMTVGGIHRSFTAMWGFERIICHRRQIVDSRQAEGKK